MGKSAGLTRSVRLIETISAKNDKRQEVDILNNFIGRMLERRATTHRILRPLPDKFIDAVTQGRQRFRHISSHGNDQGFLLGPSMKCAVRPEHFSERCGDEQPLRGRFLTISACSSPATRLWTQLHEATGVVAILAPMSRVGFADATLFYTAFYFALNQQLKLPESDQDSHTGDRLTEFIDNYQRAKIAFLGLGGRGAFRLCFWRHGVEKEII